MYSLCIGLGCSVLKALMTPFNECSSLVVKFNQHRVILSDSVVEYYMASVPDEYEDCLMTYIDSIINNEESSIFFEDNPEIDARQNLINFVMQVPMRILVSYEDEFKSYKLGKINNITPTSILQHEKNAFNMYTFPIAHHVATVGENCIPYSVWLGHLFEGEEKITIIDPYILASNGRKALFKYYLPKIVQGNNFLY